MEGVGGAEHHLGLRLAEGPQPQPVGQISVQAAQFPTLDPLAGKQQVNPDGASDASDLQEQIDEIRFGGEQLTEFVDDHEQMRHRGQVGSFATQFPVVGDRRGGVRVLELLLAAHHLTLQRCAGTHGQLWIVGEVVDQTGQVGERGEGGEGRPALVVDEDHRQILR